MIIEDINSLFDFNENADHTEEENITFLNNTTVIDFIDTSNKTLFPDYKDLPSYKAMRSLVLYFGPILMLFGTTGNILAAIVVAKSQLLWQKTTSLYIFILAIVDTICLDYGMTEFILQLCDIQVQKYLTCKFKWFIIYFLPMLEGWLLVNMSLERLTTVYFPLRKAQIFTKQRTLAGLLVIFLGCLGLNVIYLIAIQTDHRFGKTYCPARRNYAKLLWCWGWVDLAFTSVLPFFIMLACSCAIILRIVNLNLHQTRMNSSTRQRISRTTVMLLAICIVYLILTAPVAILWPVHTLYSAKMVKGEASREQVADTLILAYFFNFFWYVNYVINFYIYCLSNPRFRNEVVAIFKGSGRFTRINNYDIPNCNNISGGVLELEIFNKTS